MIIKDQVRAQSIAQTFCDEYSKKIILSTNSGPISMEEISESTGIPMSTCYRRIRTLSDAGFIRIEKSESHGHGREHDCYRSAFSKMAIRIESGGLTVEIDSQSSSENVQPPLLLAPQVRTS